VSIPAVIERPPVETVDTRSAEPQESNAMSLSSVLAAAVLFVPLAIMLGLAMLTSRPADDHRRATRPSEPEEEGPWLRLP
jgi:hypothetical protein